MTKAEWVAKRKKEGGCVDCLAKAERGVRCKACADRNAKNARLRSAKTYHPENYNLLRRIWGLNP